MNLLKIKKKTILTLEDAIIKTTMKMLIVIKKKMMKWIQKIQENKKNKNKIIKKIII